MWAIPYSPGGNLRHALRCCGPFVPQKALKASPALPDGGNVAWALKRKPICFLQEAEHCLTSCLCAEGNELTPLGSALNLSSGHLPPNLILTGPVRSLRVPAPT